MKLFLTLKVLFLAHAQFRNIFSYQMIETKYSFNLRGCKLSTPHFWKTSEENLGTCFRRCHNINLCISVSYNLASKECLGYTTCPKECDGEPRMAAWMNYCQGGWYMYLFYVQCNIYRQKGGDLTQSYDKSPYTNRNVKGTK